MKIEIGESLACSYLRHVKHCWLVQANWKVSEHWQRRQTDDELEALFSKMKQRFDRDGAVFKKTNNAAQFRKQGEIDVVGIDLQGRVHAIEVAFHEAGLSYGNNVETDNRVLKKMLRTLFVLRAYHSAETALHLYFLSPKVNPAVQRHLEETFADLDKEYPGVEWGLLTNDDFRESVIMPTLENASSIADSSELFLRSVKLLETAHCKSTPAVAAASMAPVVTHADVQPIQPLVKALISTLLVDHPDLLSDAEKRDLADSVYCKEELGLRISNLGLIRGRELSREVKGHPRYWAGTYGGFYVCSEWQRNRSTNAKRLLEFVEKLARTKSDHADALRPHAQAFRQYLGIAGH